MGRGPLSLVGMGKGGAFSMQPGKDSMWNKAWGEVGTGIDTITGARAMEKLADTQAAANAEQIANAQRQANLQAGQVQQIQQSGTEEALSKILKKKSARTLLQAQA